MILNHKRPLMIESYELSYDSVNHMRAGGINHINKLLVSFH